MNQLQQGFCPGEWYVMDRTNKVAISKLVTMRSRRKVLRAVKLGVEVVWSEWTRQYPPIGNRR